jgi:hypothetical protein
MQPQPKTYTLPVFRFNDLAAVYFENYALSLVTLTSKESKGYFGEYKDNKFYAKLEAKITEKAWQEIPSLFPAAKLGNYGFSPDSFSSIITIDNRFSKENSIKLIPKIISAFKSRTTILLNKFHGKHGRIFWQNNYDENQIKDLLQLNDALKHISSPG